jgi:hypothetical protein
MSVDLRTYRVKPGKMPQEFDLYAVIADHASAAGDPHAPRAAQAAV